MAQLPGVYHSSQGLRALLSALEVILFAPQEGLADALPPTMGGSGEPALEAEIADIALLFDVVTARNQLTPWWAQSRDKFLPWLSEWVALSQAFGLSLERRRQLVGQIVPLYAWRGTRKYLTELLSFHLPEGSDVQVDDREFVGLVVGRSRVGVDTWLEQDRPFWFKVIVRMPNVPDAVENRVLGRNEWMERIGRIIELAKPAHTTYDLEFVLSEPDDQWKAGSVTAER
jgi:phage tail-like protein